MALVDFLPSLVIGATFGTVVVTGWLAAYVCRQVRAGRLAFGFTFDRSDLCVGASWFRRHVCPIPGSAGPVHLDAIVVAVWFIPMCRFSVTVMSEPTPLILPGGPGASNVVAIGPSPLAPYFGGGGGGVVPVGGASRPGKPTEPGVN